MFANVVDCGPADIRIGMSLKVDFEPLGDDVALPVFRPEVS